jgi:polysaccharide pyruvyl transferase WcaK-like protein
VNDKIKVGLVGWNGRRNIGDDAMTASIVSHFENEFDKKNLSINILADSSQLASYTSKNTEINAFQGYNLASKIHGLRGPLEWSLFIRKLVETSNIILFGGGTIYHSIMQSRRKQRIAEFAKSQGHVRLVGAINVSLGPFESKREEGACRQAINSLDFITVRDTRSYKILQKLDIRCPFVKAMDLALTLPQVLPFKPNNNHKQATRFIGISLKNDSLSKQKLADIAEVINELQNQDESIGIRLFVFCDYSHVSDMPDTLFLYSKLLHKNRVHINKYSKNFIEFYERISACDLMIAARLHASIIAYSVGTPFLMFSYHSKCADFASEIGLSKKLIFETFSFKIKIFKKTLTDLIFTHNLSDTLPSLTLEKARQEAYKNFEFINSFFEA